MKPPANSASPWAGLLLAGGHSQRMGRDKARLDWQGRPLGEHQAGTLAGTGATPLFVACRADQPWTPATFARIEDRAEAGALGAFVAALEIISADVVLVLAVDLPLVSSAWLHGLAARARAEGGSVVPVHAHRFEPFAAAWHRSAWPALRDTVGQNRSLQEACALLRAGGLLHALAINPDEAASLANLNTPAEAARLGCHV